MPNPILGTKVHLSDVFDDITVFGAESLKTEHSSSWQSTGHCGLKA